MVILKFYRKVYFSDTEACQFPLCDVTCDEACVRRLSTRHCPHAGERRCCGALLQLVRGACAGSCRSTSPAGTALSSKPAGHRCCCRSTGQTDGRPTVTYRPCSAYYAAVSVTLGSASPTGRSGFCAEDEELSRSGGNGAGE